MIWVDNAITALFAIYTITGLIRGFKQEMFSLTVWLSALLVSCFFSHDFAVLLINYIASTSTRLVASFAALTLLTLTVGWLINVLLKEPENSTQFSLIDKLGGLLLGPAHGAVVGFVLVLMAGLTPLPKDQWWHKSKLLPPFQTTAVFVKAHMPSKLAGFINYPKFSETQG